MIATGERPAFSTTATADWSLDQGQFSRVHEVPRLESEAELEEGMYRGSTSRSFLSR